MKAILCKQWCEPEGLVLEDIPDPVAGPRQVVIAIKAAAINFFDILQIQGKHQVKPVFPFSPASEFSGVIENVGPAVTNFKIGDRVLASANGVGAREKAAVSVADVWKIPPALEHDRAASLASAYGTAIHALVDRGEAKPGETLVVLGAAGGTGLAAVEVGKLLGLRVVACASSKEKLTFCEDHGADVLVNYASEDLRARLKEIGSDRGIDIVFDPVGGDYSEAAFRAMGWGGRFLVIGFAAGPIPRIPLNLALLKASDIRGVFLGAFRKAFPDQARVNLDKVIQWAAEGKLSAAVHSAYPLEKIADAMAVLMRGEAMGKVIVHP